MLKCSMIAVTVCLCKKRSRVMRKKILLSAGLALMFAQGTSAKEGMWTPDQMPLLAGDLKALGLELDPNSLSNLTSFPMGAVISLGGCTASFVSSQGLIVTNHHCARGSVQFNSTEENNYLEKGFLAQTKKDELPAAPGSRVYVTVDVTDVTDAVRGSVPAGAGGREQYEHIENKRKSLIAECEEQEGHRCQLSSFFGGAQYKLIDRLEVRDVRLVYAPADAVGKYGGDIDNWQWPRHTGDFSFYRAYVGPDGQPADHSPDNIPYVPPHHLKVSAAGLEEGDFVMVAGYPGSTSRYARLGEVENTFDWRYPTYVDLLQKWVDVIEDTAPKGSDARIKYESRLAGLNNFLKNLKGQIAGARRVGLVGRRAVREEKLNSWIGEDPARSQYAVSIKALDALVVETATASKRNFWYNYAIRPRLLSVAQKLYRLSKERRKPDAERESGFQDRDMNFFRQGMQTIERRFDPMVDKAEWTLFLKYYIARPQNKIPVLDRALGLEEIFDQKMLSDRLDQYYSATTLGDAKVRLDLMEASPEDFEKNKDPFIRLAVALYDYEHQEEEASKERGGRYSQLRPDYMAAIIAWRKANGALVYPDANSTLRITYGSVLGGSPQDGMIYEPFTRLEGIMAKDTGADPFKAPARELDVIRAKDYGSYALASIGSVPVNFLSDLDTTGGNSGSATLNAKGELVGLLFDGTFESVNSDWDFDPRTTRSIHVDTRYMLWVMEKIDGAKILIDEMDITR